MKTFVATVVCALITVVALSAQLTWKVGWEMDKDIWGTAASAALLQYRLYTNDGTTGTLLTGVTCTGTTTISCQAPLPAALVGVSTVAGAKNQLTAKGATTAETAKSIPFMQDPTAPTGLFLSKQ